MYSVCSLATWVVFTHLFDFKIQPCWCGSFGSFWLLYSIPFVEKTVIDSSSFMLAGIWVVFRFLFCFRFPFVSMALWIFLYIPIHACANYRKVCLFLLYQNTTLLKLYTVCGSLKENGSNLDFHSLQPGWCEFVAIESCSTERGLKQTSTFQLQRSVSSFGFRRILTKWISKGIIVLPLAAFLCVLWLGYFGGFHIM